MAASLHAIITEEVSCRMVNESNQQTGLHYNVLSTFELGNELTCGDQYEEDDFCFVFTVFNLTKSSAQDYLPAGRLYSTLQSFYRFFVPVAATIKTEIRVAAAKENMHIGIGEEAILGIGTVL
jgi:predicted component of type VI protein secretion system